MSGLQRIYRPNPLAYPGIAPGIDPAHPASAKILASTLATPVSSGNTGTPGGLNLLTGAVGIGTGTGLGATYGIDGNVGPYFIPANNQSYTWPIPNVAHLPVTFAGIVILTSATATNFMGSAGWRFTWDGTHLTLVSNGVSNLASTLTLTLNVPYFIATSASSSQCYYVTTNLQTGQIRTFALGSGSGAPASDTVFGFPNGVGQGPINNMKLAAGMMNNTFMSLAQLVAFAADPWSFWYPRGLSDTIFSSFKQPQLGVPAASNIRRNLYKPNPLAFPGIAPGFDSTHPAAGPNMRFSVIARGGSYINLLTGASAVMGTTPPTVTVDGSIGQALSYNGANSSDGGHITGQFTGTDSSGTLAIICRIGGSAINQSLMTTNQNTNFNGYRYTTDGSALLRLSTSFTDFNASTLSVNTPYFIAGSVISGSGNVLLVNLQTGAIKQSNSTATYTATASNGTAQIGAIRNLGSQFFNGNIAAAMWSGQLLSPLQLQQWAADPWSFWYPRTLTDTIFNSLTAPSAAPAGLTTSFVYDDW